MSRQLRERRFYFNKKMVTAPSRLTAEDEDVKKENLRVDGESVVITKKLALTDAIPLLSGADVPFWVEYLRASAPFIWGTTCI